VFVVMVATECAPVAQAGGLGEVVFGLSRELELRAAGGHPLPRLADGAGAGVAVKHTRWSPIPN
jgi:hypothetical protein